MGILFSAGYRAGLELMEPLWYDALRRKPSMSTLSVELTDERMRELRAVAQRLGVAPEDLVRVSIDDLLSRPDEEFLATAAYLLQKNAELYRRLA
jgi:antitoxin FitA